MNIIVDNMIEVLLESPDDFLKIRETLTRIGVASKKDKKIFQSCHILHKQNRYFIVHFKELFFRANYQLVIHADLAKLVFDHGELFTVLLGEDAVEQRGFAGAEEAGEHSDGNGGGSWRGGGHVANEVRVKK